MTPTSKSQARRLKVQLEDRGTVVPLDMPSMSAGEIKGLGMVELDRLLGDLWQWKDDQIQRGKIIERLMAWRGAAKG